MLEERSSYAWDGVDHKDTIARVREVVDEHLNVVVDDPDTDLLAEGLIDSVALVDLMVAVEDAFDIRLVLNDDFVEHFRSLRIIAALVDATLSEGVA